MDAKKQRILRKFIEELNNVKGRHTELVSVYVPAGYDLNNIIGHLQQEQGTAENIKDQRTRHNVIDSLEKVIRHLRLFKKTPENGLAVFAGNASDKESKIDIKVWSIEPPEPLKVRIYRCDQKFLIDILEEMLEHRETYGLIVLDKREADIALLNGTRIEKLDRHTSGVPGKFKTGGQCHPFGTLIQLANGEIIKIEDCHNPHIVKSVDFNDYSINDSAITDKWEIKKNETYKIITKCPRLEIEASRDHLFFVRDNEVVEKPAEELRVGDYLLMPEKIDVKGAIQKLDTKDCYCNYAKKHIKTLRLPELLDKEFAQVIGYIMGDGYLEKDRINLYERDEYTAEYYFNKIKNYFLTKGTVRYKKNKNYYEVRIYGKPIVNLIKKEFPELKKALNSTIPIKILKSRNDVLAGFLRGFFDADGYASRGRIALGINNKLLVQQIQLALLRFSIISSFLDYDNRRNIYSNKHRYTVDISDKESLKNFKEYIGFTFNDKQSKLLKAIKERSDVSYTRQIIIPGSRIRKIIEDAGLNIAYFTKVTNFFRNGRQMSKYVFDSSILKQVRKNKRLYLTLKPVLDYPIIPVKIKSIKKSKGINKMVDISVKNRSFIANGVIVHNSAARFSRIREELAHEFYKRVGESANQQFLPMKELKGIIIGGPGPSKYEFLEGDFLNNEIKKKVLGVKDLGYTGEFGLEELVDRSHDLLEKERVVAEKQLLFRFFETLAKEPEKAAYGIEKVKKMLEYGAVEVVIVCESVDDNTIEEIEEIAKKMSSEVVIISIETREGEQLRQLGEVAAILRYKVNY